MPKKGKSVIILTNDKIASKILLIRGKKILLDRYLADLYAVSTKRLNEQVRRNLRRFPADFMFQLDKKEKGEVVANCDHLEILKFSPQLPYAFTEQGVAMLSSVLNSDRAIEVNIQIMRTFTRLRELMATNDLLRQRIEEMERKYNRKFASVFRVIQHLLKEEARRQIEPPKEEIGFKDRRSR